MQGLHKLVSGLLFRGIRLFGTLNAKTLKPKPETLNPLALNSLNAPNPKPETPKP